MFNLGMGEITVIVLLALIILGPKKLPELASGLGKLIREVRKTTSDVKNEIQLDDAIRKPLEELREAVTLHPEELKRRDRLRRELREAAAKMEEMAAQAEPEKPPAEGDAAAASPDATIADGAAAVPPGVAPPPFVAPPPIPPAGTVSRATSTGLPASLQRPLGTAAPGTNPPSDLSKTLTSLSEARKARTSGPHAPVGSSLFGPPPPGPVAAPPISAADRANATQILSEADLSAIADAGHAAPPPPPPAARTTGRAFAAATPRLPGSTPPKPASAEDLAEKSEDKSAENSEAPKSEPVA